MHPDSGRGKSVEHVHGRLPVVRAESGHSSPSIGGILLHSLLTTAEVSSVAAVCLWEEEQISERYFLLIYEILYSMGSDFSFSFVALGSSWLI